MSDWTSGYVADLGYTFGFYQELSPSFLIPAIRLADKEAPDLDRPFTYCELGCGQGVSTNLLASAFPDSRFFGMDFNPSQIAGARRLAEEAGCTNVRFYDDSFEEFLHRDLPQFDFITFHGIWSWVAPEHRKSMVEILRRQLKPGGVVYNSYNTLPGWAAGAPLRELLVRHGELTGGPTAGRIEPALSFVERLIAVNPAYMRSNPAARNRFEKQIKPHNRSYLAHEYFNSNWHPMYFADVAKEMSEGKVSFVASAHVTEQMDILNITPDQLKIVNEISDPIFRETVRDYMTGAQFRRDIFTKGPVRMPGTKATTHLMNQAFALVVPRGEVKFSANFPVGEVTLQETTYRPIVEILSEGQHTVSEILADKRASGISFQSVVQALMILVGIGKVHPALSKEGLEERKVSTDRFNTAVLERSKLVAELNYLASPVIGSGIGVDRISQLFLSAHLNGDDPVRSSWSILHSQNQVLSAADGVMLKTADDNLAELEKRSAAFTATRLPLLKQLGIA